MDPTMEVLSDEMQKTRLSSSNQEKVVLTDEKDLTDNQVLPKDQATAACNILEPQVSVSEGDSNIPTKGDITSNRIHFKRVLNMFKFEFAIKSLFRSPQMEIKIKLPKKCEITWTARLKKTLEDDKEYISLYVKSTSPIEDVYKGYFLTSISNASDKELKRWKTVYHFTEENQKHLCFKTRLPCFKARGDGLSSRRRKDDNDPFIVRGICLLVYPRRLEAFQNQDPEHRIPVDMLFRYLIIEKPYFGLADHMGTKSKNAEIVDNLRRKRKRLTRLSEDPNAERRPSSRLSENPNAERRPSSRLSEDPNTERRPSSRLSEDPKAERRPSSRLSEDPKAERRPSSRLSEDPKAERRPSSRLSEDPKAERRPSSRLYEDPKAERRPSSLLSEDPKVERTPTRGSEDPSDVGKSSAQLSEDVNTEGQPSAVLSEDEIPQVTHWLVIVEDESDIEDFSSWEFVDEIPEERWMMVNKVNGDVTARIE